MHYECLVKNDSSCENTTGYCERYPNQQNNKIKSDKGA